MSEKVDAIVTVNGGIAEVFWAAKGVEVEVVDFDVLDGGDQMEQVELVERMRGIVTALMEADPFASGQGRWETELREVEARVRRNWGEDVLDVLDVLDDALGAEKLADAIRDLKR